MPPQNHNLFVSAWCPKNIEMYYVAAKDSDPGTAEELGTTAALILVKASLQCIASAAGT